MKTISLNSAWQMTMPGEKAYAAEAPASDYNVLLKNGVIKDPFYGTNENSALYIGETDKSFSRVFTIDGGFLESKNVILQCESLDTLAEIYINGQPAGKSENAYVQFEKDVKEYLKEGENSIEIRFASPVEYVKRRQRKKALPRNANGINGVPYIRKPACHFGWDWGINMPVSGIMGGVKIISFDNEIRNFSISQAHESAAVVLKIQTDINKNSAGTVTAPDGKEFDFKIENGRAEIRIENPELWWTKELSGKDTQPLYTVKIENAVKRVGLRTLELDRKADTYGNNFRFILNGVPVFAKGANVIPPDAMADRINASSFEKIVDDAVRANFNMLRIWGGGYYGSDELYDLCDEKGILVWQDFMFACLMYPFYEKDFLENVLGEVKYNVSRISHHASLALWCGNNEIEFMFTYLPENSEIVKWYRKFFYDILPGELRKFDKKTPYIETSPIGDGFRKNITADKCGDTHMWHVWHGGKNLKYYTKRYTRFMSEYGMESLPGEDCIGQFAEKEEMDLFSKTMLSHQKCLSGNSKMMFYLLERYKKPEKFTDLIYLTGLIQAQCVGNAAEHFRRCKGRCNGALWWQLNDCWGAPSWSSVDYYGKWKPLMYEGKRFFSPVALSVKEKGDEAEIYLLNDTLESAEYEISVKIRDFDGKTFCEERKKVFSTAGNPLKALTVSVNETDPKSSFLQAELFRDGKKIFEKTAVFEPERKLRLKKAKIRVLVDTDKLTLESDTYARSVFVDIKGESEPLSDNSFDLIPGEPKTIRLESRRRIDPAGITVKCVNNVKSSFSEAQRTAFRLGFSLKPENIANMFYYTFS